MKVRYSRFGVQSLEGRTLTRESNSEHTASLKTSNIPFAWFLKE